jgi:hypothetical protein
LIFESLHLKIAFWHMKNMKNTFFYLIVTGGFSALIYWIISKGKFLETAKTASKVITTTDHWNEFINSMVANFQDPLAILLAQIITIIIVARFFGWIFRKIGQPSVIGEIIAGIVLGPSLLGMYFPEFSMALFPIQSLGNLKFLSQIGLIFFMFVVGMELDLKVLKNKANEAVVISHASIVYHAFYCKTVLEKSRGFIFKKRKFEQTSCCNIFSNLDFIFLCYKYNWNSCFIWRLYDGCYYARYFKI